MNRFKGGGLGTTLVLAALFVVLAVAVGLGVDRFADRIPLLSSLVGRSTQTTGPVVVEGIQRLNQLATVRWTESVVVAQEGSEELLQRYLPEFLAGEKVLLVASGEVEAGVSLDELGSDDVRVEGGTVTMELPEARILGSSLDEERTELYAWDSGWLVREDYTLVQEARREAEERILEAAEENGILEQAKSNAEDSIRAFVLSLGYEEVVFT